jgi:hypothetical protein
LIEDAAARTRISSGARHRELNPFRAAGTERSTGAHITDAFL